MLPVNNRFRNALGLLKFKFRIFTKDEEKVMKTTVQNIGSLVPVNGWQNNFTKVVWMMKWGTKTLQPVRPYIYMKRGLAVRPGEHIELSD